MAAGCINPCVANPCGDQDSEGVETISLRKADRHEEVISSYPPGDGPGAFPHQKKSAAPQKRNAASTHVEGHLSTERKSRAGARRDARENTAQPSPPGGMPRKQLNEILSDALPPEYRRLSDARDMVAADVRRLRDQEEYDHVVAEVETHAVIKIQSSWRAQKDRQKASMARHALNSVDGLSKRDAHQLVDGIKGIGAEGHIEAQRRAMILKGYSEDEVRAQLGEQHESNTTGYVKDRLHERHQRDVCSCSGNVFDRLMAWLLVGEEVHSARRHEENKRWADKPQHHTIHSVTAERADLR